MRRLLFLFAAAAVLAPPFVRASDDAIVKAYLNVAQQRALARAALKSHGISTRSTGSGPEVDLRIVFPPGQTGLDNLETADLKPVDGGAHEAEGLVIQHGGTTVGVTFQTFKDVRPGHTYDVIVNDAAHDSYRVGRITVGSASPQAFTVRAPLLGPSTPTYNPPRSASAQMSAQNVLQPWMMGFVGVTITPALLQQAGIPNSTLRGIVLSSIISGSAAQRAGLQAGDVLLVCNGIRVESMPQLLQLTENRRAGAATTLIFFRRGSLWHAVVPAAAAGAPWRPPSIGPGYVRPTSGP